MNTNDTAKSLTALIENMVEFYDGGIRLPVRVTLEKGTREAINYDIPYWYKGDYPKYVEVVEEKLKFASIPKALVWLQEMDLHDIYEVKKADIGRNPYTRTHGDCLFLTIAKKVA